jgi:glycosyltransferase involved in cell wall biosynthesis
MRIAISATEFIGWGGGIDLIRLITNALVSVSKVNNLVIYIVIQDDSLKYRLYKFACFYKNLIFDLFKGNFPKKIFPQVVNKKGIINNLSKINGEVKKIIFFKEKPINLYTKLQIDIVLPIVNGLNKNNSIPQIGYIPDLQHKHFPDFFSAEEIAGRDRVFQNTLDQTVAIIVNSIDTRKDIGNHYPKHKAKIFSLPFAPYPMEEWLEDNSKSLHKYNLPSKYFVISNQFWIHKDHATAFKALKILHKKLKKNDIHIVCTGKQEDYRFPHYFEELKELVQNNGLQNHIHFLGYISKADQIEIMKKSIAVVQTTLFEGGPGGGSVYDAIAIGVPAIVSDIPINKEIDEENIFFFKAKSADDLAEKMMTVLNKKPIHPSAEQLMAKGKDRTKKLATALLKAISFTISS